MIDTFKGEMNKSLEEIQKNTAKQLEAFKEKTKSLKKHRTPQLRTGNGNRIDKKCKLRVSWGWKTWGTQQKDNLNKPFYIQKQMVTERISKKCLSKWDLSKGTCYVRNIQRISKKLLKG